MKRNLFEIFKKSEQKNKRSPLAACSLSSELAARRRPSGKPGGAQARYAASLGPGGASRLAASHLGCFAALAASLGSASAVCGKPCPCCASSKLGCASALGSLAAQAASSQRRATLLRKQQAALCSWREQASEEQASLRRKQQAALWTYFFFKIQRPFIFSFTFFFFFFMLFLPFPNFFFSFFIIALFTPQIPEYNPLISKLRSTGLFIDYKEAKLTLHRITWGAIFIFYIIHLRY